MGDYIMYSTSLDSQENKLKLVANLGLPTEQNMQRTEVTKVFLDLSFRPLASGGSVSPYSLTSFFLYCYEIY